MSAATPMAGEARIAAELLADLAGIRERAEFYEADRDRERLAAEHHRAAYVELEADLADARERAAYAEAELADARAAVEDATVAERERMEQAQKALAVLGAARAEWLCEPCRTIHPWQEGDFILVPCPDCGTPMMPTSASSRALQEARAELAELRAENEHLKGSVRP